uniref:hypothetical protein n=1 Tax=Thaumasiovibrio occultus TaxID=1891184 RepID=UPI000B355AA9|nr:hypothetical protein [Thaumasiovibrio occultus]
MRSVITGLMLIFLAGCNSSNDESVVVEPPVHLPEDSISDSVPQRPMPDDNSPLRPTPDWYSEVATVYGIPEVALAAVCEYEREANVDNIARPVQCGWEDEVLSIHYTTVPEVESGTRDGMTQFTWTVSPETVVERHIWPAIYNHDPALDDTDTAAGEELTYFGFSYCEQGNCSNVVDGHHYVSPTMMGGIVFADGAPDGETEFSMHVYKMAREMRFFVDYRWAVNGAPIKWNQAFVDAKLMGLMFEVLSPVHGYP